MSLELCSEIMIILDNKPFIEYRCKIMIIDILILCDGINSTLIDKKL
jgi:hypothetical protein